MVQNILLASLGWLSWLCPLSTFCCVRAGKRESLNTKQALLRNGQNIVLLSTLFWSQIQYATLYRHLWKKRPFHPSQTQHRSTVLRQIFFGTGVTVVLCHVHVTSHYVDHFMILRILLVWQAWRRCSGISARRFVYISINIGPDMVSR